MARTKLIIAILCAATGVFPLLSQNAAPRKLSLEDAISLAAANNPKVTAAKARQAETKAGVQSARSSLFPKIGASETVIDSTDPVFSFGARLRQGHFTAADLSLHNLNYPSATADFTSTAGATWMLFDSGRTLTQMRAARTENAAAAEQTAAVQQSIAFEVIRAYYRALLADQEKITTKAALARATGFAKQAHDRVDAGMALPADGMQADVEVSQREQESAEAESNARMAYAQLAGVLGDASKQYSLIAPAGTPEKVLPSLEELQARAMRVRPDLMAAQKEILASRHSVKASREAYGPQISTFGNVQADNPRLTGGGNTNWTVGAKAEVQLFDGGQRRSQLSKAKAQSELAEADYQQAEIQAGIQVRQAYYNQQAAARQYGISDEMLKKTRETLRTSLDRYSAGLVTITEVLREQEQLRFMELTRVQSLYQWWIADAQLRLATGQINAGIFGVHP
ncbi:MAG TPA: TolC family protein [Acidobacteriaceae bacterium]|nr:TolC family protein [Acidobacteriaceae bacterium]